LNGLKKLKTERPELDSLYSTVFLNIPKELLRSRIEVRGIFMSDEEYEKRIKSSIFEEEELMKYCDYLIDATLSPNEVVEKFLEIIEKI
jgi:dephospho-CoA kinase